jgi:MarR family transcriptional regulator, organic hydroperoxide resistance regulator
MVPHPTIRTNPERKSIFLLTFFPQSIILDTKYWYTKYMIESEMPKQITRSVAISEIMQSLRQIFRAIQDYSQEVSKEFGITGPQLWALKIIFADGGLSLGELTQKMYLHPSTVSGVVDRLEKKGYVSRDRGREDRRVVTVRLTPEGKKLIKKAPNPIQGKMVHGLTKLERRKLNSIYDSVQKLVQIMAVQNVKATFFFDQE